MHLKRYRSNTVRDALAQARAELGPTALVLSTRMVGDRGLRGWLGNRVVEVTAAVNREMSETRQWTPVLRAPAPSPGEPLEQASGPQDRQFLATEAIIARLCATGLDRVVAADAAARIPRGKRREVSVALLQHAVADALEAVAATDTAFALAEVFIGPPGVGKTTTIAKIAAQERARRGMRLGLIAADGFRVGAVEQLRLYADIIGSPFKVARTPGELAAAIGAAKNAPVLVDTAGRGARDGESQELLTLLQTRPGIRTHLVLSAATPVREAARLLDMYASAQPSRIALTRLDETASVGALMGLLRERQLTVSYLGTGQRVPEDLSRATAEVLAAHVLGDSPEESGDRS